jgi:hypothetical protein
MSLLSIIQGAAGELAIVQPSSVITSSDTQTRQLLAICRKEGKDLARRFAWQALTKETSFTTIATETQTTLAAIGATDFARIVPETMWNRTTSLRIQGALNAEQWQRRRAAAAQAGATYYYRIRDDAILFNPTPTAGETVYFEYISSKWCESSGGTAQADWVADTDVALIDEEIIRLGLVWRWKMDKGLEYAEDFRTYESALSDVFGDDAGRQVVDMTGTPHDWDVNVPESSWSL